MMEPTAPLCDVMPLLYRAVLDRAADLARLGDRQEAERIRSRAIRAYAGSWNSRQADTLEALLARAVGRIEARRLRGTSGATAPRAVSG